MNFDEIFLFVFVTSFTYQDRCPISHTESCPMNPDKFTIFFQHSIIHFRFNGCNLDSNFRYPCSKILMYKIPREKLNMITITPGIDIEALIIPSQFTKKRITSMWLQMVPFSLECNTQKRLHK